MSVCKSINVYKFNLSIKYKFGFGAIKFTRRLNDVKETTKANCPRKRQGTRYVIISVSIGEVKNHPLLQVPFIS